MIKTDITKSEGGRTLQLHANDMEDLIKKIVEWEEWFKAYGEQPLEWSNE